jgi:hypothetical protein
MEVCGGNSPDGPDTEVSMGLVVEPELDLPGVGRPLNCVEGCSRLASAKAGFCITPAVCPLMSAIYGGSGRHGDVDTK